MDTILVVDDDPAIREIFSIYLEMEGYRIFAVTDGMACLDQLKTQIPDLILLDMMMEPLDGWETLLAIRSSPAFRDIPVIIITGKEPTHEEILQNGSLIEDFIIKPVDFKKIAKTLHHVIERDRALKREIDKMKNSMQDPELLEEYTRLLRLVRVVSNLAKRHEDRAWNESFPLRIQEGRLQELHKKLNFPDFLLENKDDGG
ncbi:MAG: response regulator [Methanoregula sp.]|nr:response regulator [Methanoregula sp.]